MGERICPIPTCDRPVYCRGWCKSHYQRWLATGDVNAEKPVKIFGLAECQVPGCGSSGRITKGYCGKHYQRWRTYGDPEAPARRKGQAPGPDNPARIPAEQLSYVGVHRRLLADRGPAASHPCQHCGSPAVDWAYDHRDPDERLSSLTQSRRHRPYVYSTDIWHYMPLCKRCHWQLDHTS